jgi:hypothetical protein
MLSAACHCRGCQRMSSSAFSLTLMLPAPGLEILAGDPVVGGLHGADAVHQFCDFCKTWVFTRIEQFGMANLRATMLDEARWFVPFIETFTSTKLPWVRTPAAASFEEFPPPETYAELLTAYAAWAAERGWPAPGAPPAV